MSEMERQTSVGCFLLQGVKSGLPANSPQVWTSPLTQHMLGMFFDLVVLLISPHVHHADVAADNGR